MKTLSTDLKNAVLKDLRETLSERKDELLNANSKDMDLAKNLDPALRERLLLDSKKIEEMQHSVHEVEMSPDPVNEIISSVVRPNGLRIENRKWPFGSILIIYESRPDVTIEASIIAFKSGNRILLKGGREALFSNLCLVECWHKALADNGLSRDWVQYMDLDRNQIQDFIRRPSIPIDLIVPRGGDRLIQFVKENASCPVLVSGRGNNFIFVEREADWSMVIPVILNAKTQKISACNALDKLLIDCETPNLRDKLQLLVRQLQEKSVRILCDPNIQVLFPQLESIRDDSVWYEEFLSLTICIALISGLDDAIEKINSYSGGHSVSILTSNTKIAESFMSGIDAAAVYHNASTRFTDGGQMGIGAEIAISTDKLHHRGPVGLEQMCSNKYFIFGSGQIRE